MQERRLLEVSDELYRTAAQYKSELLRNIFGVSAFSSGHAGSAMAKQRKVLGIIPEGNNITGVGFGLKRTEGILIRNELAIRVYVREKLPENALSGRECVPASINGMPTDVIPVGDIRALERPTPCGVSVGHLAIKAGTLGCLVKKTEGSHSDHFILSNNHVLANTNSANIGDSILQPGLDDGGDADNPIAKLAEFEPLDATGSNRIDAAIAKILTPGHVTPDILDVGLLQNPIAPAALGQEVGKRGRTTQYTSGLISDLTADIIVSYGGNYFEFIRQIAIDDTEGAFSAPGDSGSVIFNTSTRQPVALLFAGGDQYGTTFANPISWVLEKFGVELVCTN